jgi:PAS domain S-box-containing protein
VIEAGQGREKELLDAGNNITEEMKHKKRLEDLIGDLERAKEEAQKSEQQFRTLVEASPYALIISDQDGRIRRINAQSERLFGYRREELVGQQVEVLVPKRLREAHPSLRRRYHDDPRDGRRARAHGGRQGRGRIPDRDQPQPAPRPGWGGPARLQLAAGHPRAEEARAGGRGHALSPYRWVSFRTDWDEQVEEPGDL